MANATLVRRAAPAFTADAVVGTDFASVSLASLLADGHWAVLAFYPADWTFVCPTELQSFSDASATFLAHKCRVAVVSVDNKHSCVRARMRASRAHRAPRAPSRARSPLTRVAPAHASPRRPRARRHLAWMQHPRSKGGLGPMSVPVIADITKAISRSYGVLVEDPADGMCGLALRGTFIIAPNGVVRSVQVNDDQVGRNVDETLRLLQAFQYADEHGEVCPSKWKPGAATMVPNPVGSKAYFSGVPDAGAVGSGAAAAASLNAK